MAAGGLAAGPNVEFVLEDEFEELAVGKAVALGFLEAEFEAVNESGETQFVGLGFECFVHDG